MIELSDKTTAAADIYAGTSSTTHDVLAETPQFHKVYLRVMFTDNDQADSSRTMRVFVTSAGGAYTYIDATLFLKTPADEGEPSVFTLGPMIVGGGEDIRLRISASDNSEDIDISIRSWLLSDDIDYALSWAAAPAVPTTNSLTERIKTLGTDVTTLLGRVTATLFAGITSLGKWIGALAGKTADAPTLAEI
ncbi:MAG TPA: hypothetical protein VM238_21055, partial [Phycisphaerae bacterium]|nr:hypothetical protein [Phycisphaerae bacterium]